MPNDLYGADVAALRSLSQEIRRGRDELRQIAQSIDTIVSGSDLWRGPGFDRFLSAWRLGHRQLLMSAAASLSDAADAAQRNANDQERVSTLEGSFHTLPGYGLMGLAPQSTDTVRDEGLGGPDRRDGRRISRDESEDLPREDGGHLDSDWAGRTILENYLVGGKDMHIENDASWTEYMESSPTLRENLQAPLANQAEQALQDYLDGGSSSGRINETMSMTMENGESIVGHHYLHGTDRDAGGFQLDSRYSIRELPDGGYEVTLKSSYTWNDTIDPNYEYSTDQWKNKAAEILTFGQADPYEIHIEWGDESTLLFDKNGRLVEGSGYPFS